MNKQELAAMVAEILGTMGTEPMVKGSGYKPTDSGPEKKDMGWTDGDFVPDITALDLRRLYQTEDPVNPDAYRKLKERTPARLGSGKAGPRYKTLTMLRFRADHAAAQDAVFSQVPEDFPEKNGMTALQTLCRDKDEYLTRPDKGRLFDEENQKKIRAAVPTAPKVLLVVGDGLSSAAITANAMDCLQSIREGLCRGSMGERRFLSATAGWVQGMPSVMLPAVSWFACWWGSGRVLSRTRACLPISPISPIQVCRNPPGRWYPTSTHRALPRWKRAHILRS